MPSPTTAVQTIRTALRHLGVLAAGEEATGEEYQDCLASLNDVVERWNLDDMSVYGQALDQVTTISNQAVYTIGTGGNFNVPRPVYVNQAYTRVNSIDYPISIISFQEYNTIPLKDQPGQIIERLAYVNDFPLGQIYVWPRPNAAYPLYLDTSTQLGTAINQATVFNLPPGYAAALAYDLALEVATQFGITPSALLVSQQRKARMQVQKANRRSPLAQFDASLSDNALLIWQRGY